VDFDLSGIDILGIAKAIDNAVYSTVNLVAKVVWQFDAALLSVSWAVYKIQDWLLGDSGQFWKLLGGVIGKNAVISGTVLIFVGTVAVLILGLTKVAQPFLGTKTRSMWMVLFMIIIAYLCIVEGPGLMQGMEVVRNALATSTYRAVADITGGSATINADGLSANSDFTMGTVKDLDGDGLTRAWEAIAASYFLADTSGEALGTQVPEGFRDAFCLYDTSLGAPPASVQPEAYSYPGHMPPGTDANGDLVHPGLCKPATVWDAWDERGSGITFSYQAPYVGFENQDIGIDPYKLSIPIPQMEYREQQVELVTNPIREHPDNRQIGISQAQAGIGHLLLGLLIIPFGNFAALVDLTLTFAAMVVYLSMPIMALLCVLKDEDLMLGGLVQSYLMLLVRTFLIHFCLSILLALIMGAASSGQVPLFTGICVVGLLLSLVLLFMAGATALEAVRTSFRGVMSRTVGIARDTVDAAGGITGVGAVKESLGDGLAMGKAFVPALGMVAGLAENPGQIPGIAMLGARAAAGDPLAIAGLGMQVIGGQAKAFGELGQRMGITDEKAKGSSGRGGMDRLLNTAYTYAAMRSAEGSGKKGSSGDAGTSVPAASAEQSAPSGLGPGTSMPAPEALSGGEETSVPLPVGGAPAPEGIEEVAGSSSGWEHTPPVAGGDQAKGNRAVAKLKSGIPYYGGNDVDALAQQILAAKASGQGRDQALNEAESLLGENLGREAVGAMSRQGENNTMAVLAATREALAAAQAEDGANAMQQFISKDGSIRPEAIAIIQSQMGEDAANAFKGEQGQRDMATFIAAGLNPHKDIEAQEFRHELAKDKARPSPVTESLAGDLGVDHAAFGSYVNSVSSYYSLSQSVGLTPAQSEAVQEAMQTTGQLPPELERQVDEAIAATNTEVPEWYKQELIAQAAALPKGISGPARVELGTGGSGRQEPATPEYGSTDAASVSPVSAIPLPPSGLGGAE
jgi:hypothetical protein